MTTKPIAQRKSRAKTEKQKILDRIVRTGDITLLDLIKLIRINGGGAISVNLVPAEADKSKPKI